MTVGLRSIPIGSLLLLAIASGGIAPAPAVADIFWLTTGGRVEGEWLNRDKPPHEYVVIRSESGGTVAIPVEQIRETVRQRPVEIEYQRIAPTFGDTVDEQWRAAEWCRERNLPGLREHHLRRITALDPKHAKAWAALGYSQINGQWKRPIDVAQEMGYERNRGRYRLSQEVDLLNERDERDQAVLEWRRRLDRLYTLMNKPDKAPAARREFFEIRDPNAIPTLRTWILRDQAPAQRVLAMQLLRQMDSPAATEALVTASLREPNLELLEDIATALVPRRTPTMVHQYTKLLKHADNQMVNRVAYLLGRLDDRSAVGPLIDALVTTHLVGNPGAAPAGSTTSTFARDGQGAGPLGGTSLSRGGEPQVLPVTISNQQVLTALVKLTGGVSFGFDQVAWRAWHVRDRERSTPVIDGRRQ